MPRPERPIVGSRTIVAAYPSLLTRAYCRVRSRIISDRFVTEIGQFLPTQGRALEIGCGFGLFAMQFAAARPDLTVEGVDINARRIGTAGSVATGLRIDNVRFDVADARELKVPEGYDAYYMLDIIHHIPPDTARDLLRQCADGLAPGGVLIIKDVHTKPWHKMAFTWLLDVLMTGGERPTYWSKDDLVALLHGLGFEVITFAMLDALPYPHQLYVCRT